MSKAKKQLTQYEKVFNIVKKSGSKGVRTPTVMARVSATADRRLRELQEDGEVEGLRVKEGSRVKTWFVVV